MVWYDNMSRHEEPEITPYNDDDFTCITFEPDLKKFHMRTLDEDTMGKQ